MTPNHTTPRPASELLFEEYLRSNGYRDFDHEPVVEGKRKRPDYLLRWNGHQFWFEVKERQLPEQLPEPGFYDPYKGIRDEIKGATRKFKEYKDECCNLVVANQGDHRSRLDVPYLFAAMLGDLGFGFERTNPDRAGSSLRRRDVFLPKRGKLVRHKAQGYRNTTIATVIALEEANLRNPEYERLVAEATRKEEGRRGRPVSKKQGAAIASQVGYDYLAGGRDCIYPRIPRVIVCENPGARLPLCRDLLCGSFDERWALVDGTLNRIYAGGRVHEIKTLREHEEVCLPATMRCAGLS